MMHGQKNIKLSTNELVGKESENLRGTYS